MYAAILPFSRYEKRPAHVPNDTSLLQRSRGRLRLEFAAPLGITTPVRLYQEGALKVRLLATHGATTMEAVVINTAGGLTGGDTVDIVATLDRDAVVTLSTQACEKIYKSSGSDARIHAAITVAAGARLEWLAQPTILFDHCRMHRTVTAHVADDGCLLALEALVFGRMAMNEQVIAGRVVDGWKIRRGGKLIYADTFRIDGDIKVVLDNPSVLAGHYAMASLVYVAPDAEARRDEMREIISATDAVGAASAWNGLLVTRVLATDGYMLTRALIRILVAFRKQAMPRVWMT